MRKLSVYSFHLVEAKSFSAMKFWLRPLRANKISGLRHAEKLMGMTLGSPITSPSRMLVNQLVLLAQWENMEALDAFMNSHETGRLFSGGWHLRLSFIRRWGFIKEFDDLPKELEVLDVNCPVVAITLARMKLLQIPRFIRWGRPVEKLVRDHPGVLLAMAAMRFPQTVSTFTVWKTQRDMLDMVNGTSEMEDPARHIDAMREREKKDFHHEFITLRFKVLAEYGSWRGQKNIFPMPVE